MRTKVEEPLGDDFKKKLFWRIVLINVNLFSWLCFDVSCLKFSYVPAGSSPEPV